MRPLSVVLAAGILLLAACAAPPLKIYTLSGSATASQFGVNPAVIQVTRIAVPDYLDSQDIVVRSGNELVTSHHGRWASRFSLVATDLVTAKLAGRRPDALVTDQPQSETPSYRILITIDRMDVSADGAATLDADWIIMPRNPAGPVERHRGSFRAAGSVATDQDVVSLNTLLLNQLATAIDVTTLP